MNQDSQNQTLTGKDFDIFSDECKEAMVRIFKSSDTQFANNQGYSEEEVMAMLA